MAVVPLLSDCPQPTRRYLGIKHNPRPLQNLCLNLFMVKPQQFQRAHGVMLFSGGAGFVANHLNLRHHAHGNFQPLAQATGRTGGAEKHPFIATGQGGQEVQHVGC